MREVLVECGKTADVVPAEVAGNDLDVLRLLHDGVVEADLGERGVKPCKPRSRDGILARADVRQLLQLWGMRGKCAAEHRSAGDEHSGIPEISCLDVLLRLFSVRLLDERARLGRDVAEARRRVVGLYADRDDRVPAPRNRNSLLHRLAELLRLRDHLVAREESDDRIATASRQAHAERDRGACVAAHRLADDVALRDLGELLPRRGDEALRRHHERVFGRDKSVKARERLPD